MSVQGNSLKNPNPIFSTDEELKQISSIIKQYLRLPFSKGAIPGSVMEAALGYVRGAEIKQTYDFVDVVKPESRVGWQVKSTKVDTPLTWKRAKIPNSDELIKASRLGPKAIQHIGDSIINFCNKHAQDSITEYELDFIGLARLIVRPDGDLIYYEKLLCSADNPRIFDPAEFLWEWSAPKSAGKKEQLAALHGTHIPTGAKWWAWHGQGENQLHFKGEKLWWPQIGDQNAIHIERTQTEPISMQTFVEMLEKI